jgi:5-methylcytosine-specific restriction protein A
MAIPRNIGRDHVLQAIAYLKDHGVPKNAESTKYDIVDPEGNKWPPKAVMELAVQFATGNPLRRSKFSGGGGTNSRLQALGFDIRLKPDLAKSALTLEDLRPGIIITNDDVVQLFGVGNSGGMRWSGTNQCLVIIVDHTKTLYDDRWDGDVLHYTGMGKVGHQSLTGQNLRLAQQAETGAAVHLFEVFEQNKYVYAGRVVLSGAVSTENQPDDEGQVRKVFVFPLKLAKGDPPRPTHEQVQAIRRERQRLLRRRTTEQLLQMASGGGKQKPGRRCVVGTQYERNEAVAEYVKRAANGICGLCLEPAPFETMEGPYLECHHVEHLAEGGPDTIENAIALCPNCHRRMHVLDLRKDRDVLRSRMAERDSMLRTS